MFALRIGLRPCLIILVLTRSQGVLFLSCGSPGKCTIQTDVRNFLRNGVIHTRPFGYPPNTLISQFPSLERNRTPSDGARPSRGVESHVPGGLFCLWRVAYPSGGIWRDARPSWVLSFLLLSRDSDLMSHWSIRCPPDDSLLIIPVA